jgi:hypothetical protein
VYNGTIRLPVSFLSSLKSAVVGTGAEINTNGAAEVESR